MATPEVIAEQQALVGINADYKEKYGFFDPENYLFKAPKGLTQRLVEDISEYKNEPQWMRDFRLKALTHFLSRPQPTWGSPMLAEVDYDNIHYFVRASERAERSWDDVPDDIKKTFDRLGIREHEDLVREHFATVIPPNDNKLAALNSAVWSGGSFVYVPPGVHVEMPLQAYFRINTENMGQFERTLIIADEGSYVHYVEGCTAPTYSSDSLHSAVVELFAKPGARIRYTTVQNWSNNVFNLVTKRAHGSRSKVVCDALLLDEDSRSDTYPTIRIGEDDVDVGHEATVSKVGEEQLFYLMSHGIPEDEASKLIVNGFIEPIVKELPMEYAVEMNRLIELQMEGSIG